MQDHLVQFVGTHPVQQPFRYHYPGRKESDHRRPIQLVRNAQLQLPPPRQRLHARKRNRAGALPQRMDSVRCNTQKDRTDERGRRPNAEDPQAPPVVDREPGTGSRRNCGGSRVASPERRERQRDHQSKRCKPDRETYSCRRLRQQSQTKSNHRGKQKTLPQSRSQGAGGKMRNRHGDPVHCASSSAPARSVFSPDSAAAAAISAFSRASSSGSISSSPRTESRRRSREFPKKRLIICRISDWLASFSEMQG